MMAFESLCSTVDAIRSGQSTCQNVVHDCLMRIERLDAQTNSFREVFADEAMQRAAEIDLAIQRGDSVGALAGIPVAVKDNIATRLGRTSCGSRMLEHFISPYESTATRRLLDAGAIIVGKTNCDEFAMGSSTEHCAFGAVRNPWAPDRVPGGSSGGSAAAVAARLCPAALGSDTGGSVRQPAALCGVVGLKPSYGRVSRYGLVAFGSSFDQVGLLTTCIEDAALLLQIIAGHDVADSTSADITVPNYLEEMAHPIDALRVGVPRQYLDVRNDDSIRAVSQEAMTTFQRLGASVVEVDLPLTDYGIATYYVIAAAEASSNLARYDGVRYGRRADLKPDETLADLYERSRSEGFGPEVQRRIMLGTYALSAGYYDAYYQRAQQVRRLIKDEFDRAFEQCDVLLGPTTPAPAFRIGDVQDPLAMYLCDVYTAAANIAGICAISLPGGFADADGVRLPLGIQLQAQSFDEVTLLRAASMFESITDFHTALPDLAREVSR